MAPLLLGFGRGNPYRAFGDAVYLSEYWSAGAPSRREIDKLLTTFRKMRVYQCYFDAGDLSSTGLLKFPDQADHFMWDADAFCQRENYPMKFVAWVRNARENMGGADLRSEVVVRNFFYGLKYLSMFKGVHLDFEFWAEEQGPPFLKMIESIRKDFPTLSISVLARRPWMQWRGFAERLVRLVGDIEVCLYDSAREGESYAMWCSQQIQSLVDLLGYERLIVTVPAFHQYDERHGPGETVTHALRGMKHGLKARAPARVRVAVYREGLATQEDWTAFRSEWAR